MWVNLHTHSSYSFLRGLASPLELAQAAAAQGMPALGLADSGVLSGAIEFYDACRTHGVHPILGLELPVSLPPDPRAGLTGLPSGNGVLVLLAMDQPGWSNLCRLSSQIQTGDQPELPLAGLAGRTDGLLCLSGGLRGLAAPWLARGDVTAGMEVFEQLQAFFPDRLYLELQASAATPGEAEQRWCTNLLRLAKRLGRPLAASVDIHYLRPEQAGLQRLVSAIRLNLPLNELPDQACALPGSYFMDQEALLAALSRLPVDAPQRALNGTLEVAERCQLELPVGIHHYPHADLPGEPDSDLALRQRAEAGAIQRYGPLNGEIRARLDHELETIQACGYASLFLIMQEIIQFTRQAGVPVSSRGSAASSLVAHCLGITTPDPIRLNLYFERFLNPMRVTPPDIDTDLCSRRRDQVIRFVYQRFGEQRVAMVSTINRFRSRSALRETAKAHGLPPAQVSALLEKLPYRWWGPPGREVTEADAFASLESEHPHPPYPEIFQAARAIIGLPRHLSIHPGGVVIAPGLLNDLAPVQLAPKGITITQFDLVSVERLGLLKIDLLGIRGLTVLGDVAEAIAAERAAAPDRPGAAQPAQVMEILESIPAQDEATSQTLQAARTIGCFQIESPGMRATLREIQARSSDDLMVALALYRPGPLTGGLKEAFVERFKAKTAQRRSGQSAGAGGQASFYLHPALEPMLQETYGVILYQEQVLRIAHELAGFNLSDADLLRRAMSHFDLDRQMLALKEKFLLGAANKHQVSEAIAGRVWEQMAAFAGYGFPKAHAASYAEVAWRAAWCKTHYPAVFMAAVLANWGGYYSQRIYLTEARRMGLTVKPPLVELAQAEFSLGWLKGQPALVMGLGQVKELTGRTIQRIIQGRPFTSLSDFLARVDPRRQEAYNLIACGALEGFGSQPALLARLKGKIAPRAQLNLFPDSLIEAQPATSGEDWSLAEKVAAQEQILGASLEAHPLELLAPAIAASRALNTVEAAARLGQAVRVAGMRQTWRRSRTRGGESIYFMALEDLEGMLDVVISSPVYQRCRQALRGPGPYLIEGTVELSAAAGEPEIRAARITSLVD